jgi:hypothetical protein
MPMRIYPFKKIKSSDIVDKDLVALKLGLVGLYFSREPGVPVPIFFLNLKCELQIQL